jgi:hypothetical protein
LRWVLANDRSSGGYHVPCELRGSSGNRGVCTRVVLIKAAISPMANTLSDTVVSRAYWLSETRWNRKAKIPIMLTSCGVMENLLLIHKKRMSSNINRVYQDMTIVKF